VYAKAELVFKGYGLGKDVEKNRGRISLLPTPQIKLEG